jgi:hypothetical protein
MIPSPIGQSRFLARSTIPSFFMQNAVQAFKESDNRNMNKKAKKNHDVLNFPFGNGYIFNPIIGKGFR